MGNRLWLGAAMVALSACATQGAPVPPPLGVELTKDAYPAVPLGDATDIAAGVRDGSVQVEALVAAYLKRIDAVDAAGPALQSVLTLNPNAISEARSLDAEARAGNFRGPLHGVPVLVKDNIETRDMPTTAGSLALAANATGRDAPIIAKLRDAGAIILGKTNLSEWANFRSNSSISGWSGLGGQTKNPHSLDRSPCGSSAGSGAATAAMLAPLTIGTETNGSILCPAAMNGVVGFKPTVGLLSRSLIVPISSTQDTAGPMVRTVRDAALMLTVMAGSDSVDAATAGADLQRTDYTAALTDDLSGVRVGVLRFAVGSLEGVEESFEVALDDLRAAGAEIIDIDDYTPPSDYWGAELLVLETEFKATLNEYLKRAAPGVEARSLAALIEFNEQSERELALFDQSLFYSSEETGGLNDPAYQAALTSVLTATRDEGIDALLEKHNVDVLVAPSRPPAFHYDAVFTDQYPGVGIGAGWMAATAGYPSMTVPMGQYRGLPIGIDIMAGKWQDATVLKVGYAYEQQSRKIAMPSFAQGAAEVPATAAAMAPFREDAE